MRGLVICEIKLTVILLVAFMQVLSSAAWADHDEHPYEGAYNQFLNYPSIYEFDDLDGGNQNRALAHVLISKDPAILAIRAELLAGHFDKQTKAVRLEILEDAFSLAMNEADPKNAGQVFQEAVKLAPASANRMICTRLSYLYDEDRLNDDSDPSQFELRQIEILTNLTASLRGLADQRCDLKHRGGGVVTISIRDIIRRLSPVHEARLPRAAVDSSASGALSIVSCAERELKVTFTQAIVAIWGFKAPIQQWISEQTGNCQIHGVLIKHPASYEFQLNRNLPLGPKATFKVPAVNEVETSESVQVANSGNTLAKRFKRKDIGEVVGELVAQIKTVYPDSSATTSAKPAPAQASQSGRLTSTGQSSSSAQSQVAPSGSDPGVSARPQAGERGAAVFSPFKLY